MYYGPDHRSHSGIGKATALSLADRGAHVLVGGRDTACGDAVVAPIQAKGGKADFVAADLRSADSARSFARRAIKLGGGQAGAVQGSGGVGVDVRPGVQAQPPE